VVPKTGNPTNENPKSILSDKPYLRYKAGILTGILTKSSEKAPYPEIESPQLNSSSLVV
jgi:hypothetical protein